MLFCYAFFFLKIRNKNTAQTGIDKIKPSKKPDARHATKPPIARPILPLPSTLPPTVLEPGSNTPFSPVASSLKKRLTILFSSFAIPPYY